MRRTKSINFKMNCKQGEQLVSRQIIGWNCHSCLCFSYAITSLHFRAFAARNHETRCLSLRVWVFALVSLCVCVRATLRACMFPCLRARVSRCVFVSFRVCVPCVFMLA